jgi:hypothetical protein
VTAVHEVLKSDGVIQLRFGEHPYSEEDVLALIELCKRMPVKAGIGDTNRVSVGRIVVDPVDIIRETLGYPRAHVEDSTLAREILGVVASDSAMAYWREALNQEPLMVQRAQANFLHEGGEVDFHNDHESNPSYSASIVVGLSNDYTGGEFIAEVSPGEIRRFRVERGDVLVSKPELRHAVTRVASGMRLSVVMFMTQSPSNPETAAASPA